MGCVNTYRLFTDFYSYDPISRPTARQINERSDSFAYNAKSELTAAQLGTDNYGYSYSYDNIGNRKTAQEIAEEITYSTNSTNEYTAINDFTPEFDLDGNQTKLQTSTGIWAVEYNAENRPTKFTSEDGSTIIEATYDYMGRRAWKKVTINGVITYHQAYIYRGYLQIAAENLIEGKRWSEHLITWDPTQPTATRPLAIEQKGTWFTYGLDLSKNVTELYTAEGTIASSYTYSPFGAVEATGNTANPIQWSSEIADEELGLVYYNYRSYNPADGRWINRDPIAEEGGVNLYGFVENRVWEMDELGLVNLGSAIKNILRGLNTAQSGDVRKSFGPILLAIIPIPIVLSSLRLNLSGTLSFSPCCYQNKEIRYSVEAEATLFGYLQIGLSKSKVVLLADKKTKKRQRRVAKKNSLRYDTYEPNHGFSERSSSLQIVGTSNRLPKCADGFSFGEWTISAEANISIGTYFGAYGYVKISVSQSEDFTWDTIMQNFEASAGFATGIYGASVEVGVSGSIGAKYTLPI